MTRETYVLRKGKLVPKRLASPHPHAGKRSLNALSDITEFRSTVDGSVISSRSHLRDHNRAHGVVQVGNERLGRRMEPTPPVMPDLLDAVRKHGL